MMYGTPGGILSVLRGAVRYSVVAMPDGEPYPDSRRWARAAASRAAASASRAPRNDPRIAGHGHRRDPSRGPMVCCTAALLHAPSSLSIDCDRVLGDRFGLAAFHPWQREAIDALLDGDGQVLLVAPTGGGKSLCYQLPSVVLPGTTIVISPLIALMEDQVMALAARSTSPTF